MYKLFDIVKYKTSIKGFWIDNGKVYIDNIIIKDYIKVNLFIEHCNNLFNVKKQKTIFYIKNNKAYIEDREGNTIILKHCIRYKERHITKRYIRALLTQHEGLTVYREARHYIIEIWKG